MNDYAAALSPADRDRLERELIARGHGTSNQVVVAVFRSLEGESLEDFSVHLAQSWGIGRKGLDNGVAFLVFLDDRKMRIEVGYGLEASLTDAVAGSIIRDVVAPRFREGRLADGLSAGLAAIDAAIAGTYRAPSGPAAGSRGLSGLALLGLGLIALTAVPLLVLTLVQARQSQRHGWTGSDRGWSGGGWGGGWPPGPGIGGNRGGSRVGGFGGGGGSFGGGGASGSW